MRNRHSVIYGLVILGLLFIWGCSKQSDIVAPSGSTITMSEDLTVSRGPSGTISATVEDSDAERMNGVAVDFSSSHPRIAGFSSTQGEVYQTRVNSDDSGVASVAFYAYSTGSATITGAITGTSDTVTVTVE